jgi:hypothetical protein
MYLRSFLWLLALCLPAAGAYAAPTILCGHTLLQRQQERNALLPEPKPLTPLQLRRSRQRNSFSIAAAAAAPKRGDKTKFWGLDFTHYDGTDPSIRHYRLTATLRLITENAYIYVEDNAPASDRSLANLAETFEQKIVPSTHQYFGKPWTPGIDGDPRVTLLVMNIRSPGGATGLLGLGGVTVGGFFNDEDEYLNDEKLHPFSNEREMVTLNAAMDAGSALVQEVLAHEYQHLVHWHHDRDEAVWVNEGLSMVAPVVAGLSGGPLSSLGNAIMAYGLDYDNSLTVWGDRGQEGITGDYGAAGLFFTYLGEKFGGPETFLKLAGRKENGVEGVLAGLKDAGHALPFAELFTRWTVANLADDTALGEPYGYSSPEVRNLRGSLDALHQLLPDLIPTLFQPGTRLKSFPAKGSGTLRPQAAHYVELTGTGTLNLQFDGAGHPFEVFVLVRGTDDQYQLFPVALNSQSRTGTASVPGLGSSVGVVYLVIANVTEGEGESAEYRYEALVE